MTDTYANAAPVATATALPPELPPEIRQLSNFSSTLLDLSSVFSIGEPHTFLVGPKRESTVPDLKLNSLNRSNGKITCDWYLIELPHRKLVKIRFTDNNCAGLLQTFDHSRIVRW